MLWLLDGGEIMTLDGRTFLHWLHLACYANALVTRKPSSCKSFQDGRYYRTGNKTMRSADPENPCLEPDME